MIRKIIEVIVGGLASPLTKLGEKYLANQIDSEKIKAGVTQAAIQADTAVRTVKLSSKLAASPLLLAEMTCALYLATIFIDSSFPSDWLNPLELPGWFMPYFNTITISLLGTFTLRNILGGK